MPRQAEASTSAPGDPVHILIACMPKSGSTFLTDVIAELPGFRRAVLIPMSERREQELDEFCLQQADGFSYVSQNHVRHSAWTADMCREYNLKPIVLVRGLLDIVVSLRDHMRAEGHQWPNFFAEAKHAALDDAELERMIARLALPWYVNFYMGWRAAPDRLIVSYEELIGAPTRVVGDILAYAGAPAPAEDIARAVERVQGTPESRFNVGVRGRGSMLRPDTIREVLQLLEFYPAAAGDPYVQAIASQAHAALSGEPAPIAESTLSATRLRPQKGFVRGLGTKTRMLFVRGLGTKTRILLVRRVLPLGLVILALLYWLYPNDLITDSRSKGFLDDALILLAVAFMAGRFSRHKANRRRPRQRLRRQVMQPQPT